MCVYVRVRECGGAACSCGSERASVGSLLFGFAYIVLAFLRFGLRSNPFVTEFRRSARVPRTQHVFIECINLAGWLRRQYSNIEALYVFSAAK